LRTDFETGEENESGGCHLVNIASQGCKSMGRAQLCWNGQSSGQLEIRERYRYWMNKGRLLLDQSLLGGAGDPLWIIAVIFAFPQSLWVLSYIELGILFRLIWKGLQCKPKAGWNARSYISSNLFSNDLEEKLLFLRSLDVQPQYKPLR